MSGNRCEFVILTSDLPEQEINFLHERQRAVDDDEPGARVCFYCHTDRKWISPGFVKEGVGELVGFEGGGVQEAEDAALRSANMTSSASNLQREQRNSL